MLNKLPEMGSVPKPPEKKTEKPVVNKTPEILGAAKEIVTLREQKNLNPKPPTALVQGAKETKAVIPRSADLRQPLYYNPALRTVSNTPTDYPVHPNANAAFSVVPKDAKPKTAESLLPSALVNRVVTVLDIPRDLEPIMPKFDPTFKPGDPMFWDPESGTVVPYETDVPLRVDLTGKITANDEVAPVASLAAFDPQRVGTFSVADLFLKQTIDNQIESSKSIISTDFRGNPVPVSYEPMGWLMRQLSWGNIGANVLIGDALRSEDPVKVQTMLLADALVVKPIAAALAVIGVNNLPDTFGGAVTNLANPIGGSRDLLVSRMASWDGYWRDFFANWGELFNRIGVVDREMPSPDFRVYSLFNVFKTEPTKQEIQVRVNQLETASRTLLTMAETPEDYDAAYRLAYQATELEVTKFLNPGDVDWSFIGDPDRLQNHIRVITDFKMQTGRSPNKWERISLSAVSVDPAESMAGQMVFDLYNLFDLGAGVVIEGMAKGSIKGISFLGRKFSKTTPGIKALKFIDPLIRESTHAASNRLMAQAADLFNAVARKVSSGAPADANLFGLFTKEIERVANTTVDVANRVGAVSADGAKEASKLLGLDTSIGTTARGRMALDLSRVSDPATWTDRLRKASSDLYQKVFDHETDRAMDLIARKHPDWSVAQIERDAIKLAQAKALAVSEDLRAVSMQVAEGLRREFVVDSLAWKGSKLFADDAVAAVFRKLGWDVAANKSAARAIVDGIAEIGDTAIRWWVKQVLATRPGWLVINAVDSTVRFLIGGGALFDDVSWLFSTDYEKLNDALGGYTPTILSQSMTASGLGIGYENPVTRIFQRGWRPTGLWSFFDYNVKTGLDLAKTSEISPFMRKYRAVANTLDALPRTVADINSLLEFNLRARMLKQITMKRMASMGEDVFMRTLAGMSPDAAALARKWWTTAGLNPSLLTRFATGENINAWAFIVPPHVSEVLSTLPTSQRNEFTRNIFYRLDAWASQLAESGQEITDTRINEVFDDLLRQMEEQEAANLKNLHLVTQGGDEAGGRPTPRQASDREFTDQINTEASATVAGYEPSDGWLTIRDRVRTKQTKLEDFSNPTFRQELKNAGIDYESIRTSIRDAKQSAGLDITSKTIRKRINQEAAQQAFDMLERQVLDNLPTSRVPAPPAPKPIPETRPMPAVVDERTRVFDYAPQAIRAKLDGNAANWAELHKAAKWAGVSPDVRNALSELNSTYTILNRRFDDFSREVLPGPMLIGESATERSLRWDEYWKMQGRSAESADQAVFDLLRQIEDKDDLAVDVPSRHGYLEQNGIVPQYKDGQMVGFTHTQSDGITKTYWDRRRTDFPEGARPHSAVDMLRLYMGASTEDEFKAAFRVDDWFNRPALEEVYQPKRFEDVVSDELTRRMITRGKYENAARRIAAEYKIATDKGDSHLVRIINKAMGTKFNKLSEAIDSLGRNDEGLRAVFDALEARALSKSSTIEPVIKSHRSRLMRELELIETRPDYREFNIKLLDSMMSYVAREKGLMKADGMPDLDAAYEMTIRSFRFMDEIPTDRIMLEMADGTTPLSRISFTDEEFKDWWKAGKVVDDKGQPLLLYRGLNSRARIVPIENYDIPGVYATKILPDAEMYANSGGRAGAYIAPVYMSLQNPAGVAELDAVRKEFGWTRKHNGREIAEELQTRGYDGLILPNEYIAFNRDAVRSALDFQTLRRPEPSALFRSLSTSEAKKSWYYSQMYKILDEKLPNKVNVDSIRGLLQGQVKTDELKATQFEEWLDARKGEMVRKSDVMDYLAENRVEIEEQVFGDAADVVRKFPAATPLQVQEKVNEVERSLRSWLFQSNLYDNVKVAYSDNPEVLKQLEYWESQHDSVAQYELRVWARDEMRTVIRDSQSRKKYGVLSRLVDWVDGENERVRLIEAEGTHGSIWSREAQSRLAEIRRSDEFQKFEATARELGLYIPPENLTTPHSLRYVMDDVIYRSDDEGYSMLDSQRQIVADQLHQLTADIAADERATRVYKPQYSSFTYPGQKSGYREFLLTWPDPNISYSGPHWRGEKNILAHIRVSERTAPDGKKVLFIEEVQSDWYQAAAKQPKVRAQAEEYVKLERIKGEIEQVATDLAETQRRLAAIRADGRKPIPSLVEAEREYQAKLDALYAEHPKLNRQLGRIEKLMSTNREWDDVVEVARIRTSPKYARLKELATELDRIYHLPSMTEKIHKEVEALDGTYIFSRIRNGQDVYSDIPVGPFSNTEAWSGLAMKRITSWAADHGYDTILFPSGPVAAKIEGHMLMENAERFVYDEANWKLTAIMKDGQVKIEDFVTPEDIGKYISDDAASQLLAATPDNDGLRSIPAGDVVFGGERMRPYYDNILINSTNKALKKYGIRVEDMKLADDTKEGRTLYTVTDQRTGQVIMDMEGSLSGDEVSGVLQKRLDDLGIPLMDRQYLTVDSRIIAGYEPVHGFTIPKSAQETILREGMPLFRRAGEPAEAAMLIDKAGKALIMAFEKNNPIALWHEVFHMLPHILSDDDVRILEDVAGLNAGDFKRLNAGYWELNGASLTDADRAIYVDAQEKVARLGEKYMVEDFTVKPEYRSIFTKIKQWIARVYAGLKDILHPDLKMTPEFRDLMDRLTYDVLDPRVFSLDGRKGTLPLDKFNVRPLSPNTPHYTELARLADDFGIPESDRARHLLDIYNAYMDEGEWMRVDHIDDVDPEHMLTALDRRREFRQRGYDRLTKIKTYDKAGGRFSAEVEAAPYKVFTDLVGLKWLNDAVSHDAGDDYLVGFVNWMEQKGYTDNIYRAGGDEFIITVQSEDEAKKVIEDMKDLNNIILGVRLKPEDATQEVSVVYFKGFSAPGGYAKTVTEADVASQAARNAIGIPRGGDPKLVPVSVSGGRSNYRGLVPGYEGVRRIDQSAPERVVVKLESVDPPLRIKVAEIQRNPVNRITELNAFGEGEKGVTWLDGEGRSHFTPLTEADYEAVGMDMNRVMESAKATDPQDVRAVMQDTTGLSRNAGNRTGTHGSPKRRTRRQQDSFREAWAVYINSPRYANGASLRSVWGDKVVDYDEFMTFIKVQFDRLRGTKNEVLRTTYGALINDLSDLQEYIHEVVAGTRALAPASITSLPKSMQTWMGSTELWEGQKDVFVRAMNAWKNDLGGRVRDGRLLPGVSPELLDEVKGWAETGAKSLDELTSTIFYGGEINGRPVNSAIKEVGDIMIDYTKTSVLDENIKKVIPFWMFPSRSIPWWWQFMSMHPEVAAFYSKYVLASQRLAIQEGAVNSQGEALPSLRGYYQIGNTGLWWNPLKMVSAWAALPGVTRNPDYEDADTNQTPMQQLVAWMYDTGQDYGLQPGPWVTIPLTSLGLIDPESTPHGSLIPAIDLIPPHAQKYLIAKLRSIVSPEFGDVASQFFSYTPWEDYNIEKMMLTDALKKMQDPSLSQAQKLEILKPIADVLNPLQGVGDTLPSREDNPLWQEYAKRASQQQHANKLIGQFTGIYPKNFGDDDANFVYLKNYLNLLRSSINDQIGADVLELPDNEMDREALYRGVAYDTAEGSLLNLYNQIRFVRADDGSPAYGDERRKIVAQNLDLRARADAYYATKSARYKEMIDSLRALSVGSASKVKYEIIQTYFDEIAEIEKNPLYAGVSRGWSEYNKSSKTIEDHYRTLWWKMLQDTKPRYEPIGAGSDYYEKWTQQVEDWKADLPNLAKSLFTTFQRKFQPKVSVTGTAANLGVTGDTDLGALFQSFLKESTADGYTTWKRMYDDSPLDAIDNAWTALYWDPFQKAVAGSSSYTRQLKERMFALQHPNPPTFDEIYWWVRSNYGDRFSREQLYSYFDGRSVMTTEQRYEQTQDEMAKLKDEFMEILSMLQPGSVERKSVRAEYQGFGGNASYFDAAWMIESVTDIQDLQNNLNALRRVKEKRALQDPSLDTLKEWSAVYETDRLFKKTAEGQFNQSYSLTEQEKAADFFPKYYQYMDSSSGDRKTFRDENPEIYQQIQAYEKFRDLYAVDNQLWAKYYNPSKYRGEIEDTSDTSTGAGGWRVPASAEAQAMRDLQKMKIHLKNYSDLATSIRDGVPVRMPADAGVPDDGSQEEAKFVRYNLHTWPKELLDQLPDEVLAAIANRERYGIDLGYPTRRLLTHIGASNPEWMDRYLSVLTAQS